MSQRLVVATANPGKLHELEVLLGGMGLSLSSLESFPGLALPPETGDSYAQNATTKASFTARATGLWAVGDDSGLMVDALDGRPGLHSARYGGPGMSDADRNCLLLQELANVPEERRGATFVCVAALAIPVGDNLRIRLFEGRCRGIITGEFRGESGFGFDPLFLYPPRGQTFAQMGQSKHSISHRALALEGLRHYLSLYLERGGQQN